LHACIVMHRTGPGKETSRASGRICHPGGEGAVPAKPLPTATPHDPAATLLPSPAVCPDPQSSGRHHTGPGSIHFWQLPFALAEEVTPTGPIGARIIYRPLRRRSEIRQILRIAERRLKQPVDLRVVGVEFLQPQDPHLLKERRSTGGRGKAR